MKRVRRSVLCILLCVSMFMCIVSTGSAEANISVILDGNFLSFDVPPQIIDGRTMVPMRTIFEAMGAFVNWNGNSRTIVATKDDTMIIMQIDNPVLNKDGVSIQLDVPPQIVDDRTLVPIRAVAESFDAQVSWHGDTSTVIIKTIGSVLSPTPTPAPMPSPDPTPAPQPTPSVQGYAAFPSVPDFGAFLNVPLQDLQISDDGGTYFYFYDILYVTTDMLDAYINLIESAGFLYYDSMTLYTGEVHLLYTNEECMISIGLMGYSLTIGITK